MSGRILLQLALVAAALSGLAALLVAGPGAGAWLLWLVGLGVLAIVPPPPPPAP